MSARWRLIVITFCLFARLMGIGAGQPTQAADDPRVRQAVSKANGFLSSHFNDSVDHPEQSLVALAMLKSGTPASDQRIQKTVEAIRKKITGGVYKPVDKHIYEAGMDATLLVEINAEAYQEELRAISQYVIERQFPSGSWDYPADSREGGRGTQGDTSVVQYACLALWAAERGGVDIQDDVWGKCVEWLRGAMNADGGYSYIPGTKQGLFNGQSDLNMTFAGMGALLICARNLYPSVADEIFSGSATPEKKKEQPEKTIPGLEKIDISKLPKKFQKPKSKVNVSLSQIRATLKRGSNWVNTRFRPYNPGGVFPYYYFYTLERFGALAQVDKIGGNDWYAACGQELFRRQKSDGSWPKQQLTNVNITTSFVILFLVRSTGKVVGIPEDPSVGGGLLTGGKGPPKEAVEAAKEPLPIEKLIQSLQNPENLDLVQLQSDLIEQVQIGDKSALIGQKERLKQLITHPHGEVRRTAAWALGRTNDLSMGRYLIDALEDKDLGVMIEAQSSLCWLSRKFDGVGLPVNPLDELPENATETEKAAAITAWRDEARRIWGNWYLKVRPYADRGDEFEAKLRQRLGK